jgi:hypothetical protein
MVLQCNTSVIYCRGISGFSHLRARDVMSSVKGHHVLLTTQRAIINHKEFYIPSQQDYVHSTNVVLVVQKQEI